MTHSCCSPLVIIGFLAAMTSAQTLRGGDASHSFRRLQGQQLFGVQQTYQTPRQNGLRVDFCYGYDFRMGPGFNPAGYIECGQGAADAFCKSVGYDNAFGFDKDPQVQENTVMLLQPGASNPGSFPHDAFRSITCQKQQPNQPTQPPATFDAQTFLRPTMNDIRLDWCGGYDYSKGANNPAAYLDCGEPTATRFCQTLGFTKATSWEEDYQIKEPTLYITQNTLNASPLHDSFHSITCSKY